MNSFFFLYNKIFDIYHGIAMAQVAKNILLPETEDDDTLGPVYDFNYGRPSSQIVLV